MDAGPGKRGKLTITVAFHMFGAGSQAPLVKKCNERKR